VGYQPGTVVARFEMTVELGKVREFARATQATHPHLVDAEAPPITPTFLMSAALWQPPDAPQPYEALGMELERLLHGEQEFEFFGPPPGVGRRLAVEVLIESIVEKRGRRGGVMRVGRIVTNFVDETGTLVARSRTTAIETEAQ
jgi:hypothetical protein